ncbi:MAG TPA: esterase, partial [Gammaproteobacteria bacterium]|nr:esterase [Gammaproteobacteria bacterium]
FLGKKMGEVVSTAETVSFWTRNNQCAPVPKTDLLDDTDVADGSRVEVTRYGNCLNDADVILYSIIGGGHSFPRGNIPDRPLLLGRKNKDINAAEVIWDFFRKHQR